MRKTIRKAGQPKKSAPGRKRGGFRPGAGRPSTGKNAVTVSFCLSREMDSRIRQAFERRGETYTTYLKKHFELCIDEIEKI